jgi:hypothetical protein
MSALGVLITLMGLLPAAFAHMEMSYPPPLRSKFNTNVASGAIDYNMVAPLSGDGSNFPCKGYLSDLGTPAGKSVDTWAAGSSHNFTIVGGASHGGGSCQASLSYDQGKTFTVIHSYIGNCPLTANFNFNVPSDAPAGDALFVWTWYNKIGNREIYMNCASVTIGGTKKSKRTAAARRASTPFSSRPSIFVANLANGCTTIETQDVIFPDPGPDVDRADTTTTPGGFTGTCAAVKGVEGGSSGSAPAAGASGGSGGASSAAAAASPSSEAGPSQGGVFATTASPLSTATASVVQPATPTGVSTGALQLSPDGTCGGNFGCSGSPLGSCCSQFGFCGKTDAYCGTGCQSAFGTCGTSAATNPGNSSASTSLQVSTDKTCGSGTSNTCQGSTFGSCCSQFGYCGSTSDYCGTGCQAGFGACGTTGEVISSSSAAPSSSMSLSLLSASLLTSTFLAVSGGTLTVTNTNVDTTKTITLTGTSTPAYSGFVGVTQSSAMPSGFVTSVVSSSVNAPAVTGTALVSQSSPNYMPNDPDCTSSQSTSSY